MVYKRPSTSVAHLSIVHATPIREIVSMLPEAETLLNEYGIHCFSCGNAAFETLDEGCCTHGLSSEDIDELVDELNRLLKKKPPKPNTLHITKAAAVSLFQMLQEKNKIKGGLAVTTDDTGNFCMEFREKKEGDFVFSHSDVPKLSIFASDATLSRIGGATIDLRNGRFALDL